MDNPQELIGKRFGALESVDFILGKPFGNSRYICLCDCGGVKLVSQFDLIKNKATSCGCGVYRNTIKIQENREELFLKHIYLYKYMKRHKKYSPDVTSDLLFEDFLVFFRANCFYCGRNPSNAINDCSYEGEKIPYQGIDRVDSKKGYFRDNCVPCCIFCNNFKSDLTQEEFLKKIQQIADSHGL